MFNVKKALAGVLAGVTLISVAACGNGPDPAAGGSSSQQGQTVEQIKKTGKIRIATFGDLPPYGYVKNDAPAPAMTWRSATRSVRTLVSKSTGCR